jgi:hypothetical protein
MKYFILICSLVLFTGCSSIQMEKGAKGSDSYEKITFRGPPKDFKALDFKFGEDTRLKAGEAATAEQPWADVVGDWSEILGVIAYCKANPLQCQKIAEGD